MTVRRHTRRPLAIAKSPSSAIVSPVPRAIAGGSRQDGGAPGDIATARYLDLQVAPPLGQIPWRLWIRKLPWIVGAVLVTDLMVGVLTLRQKPEFQAATVVNTGVSSGVSLSGAPTDWFRAGALIANIEEVLRSRTVLEGTIRLVDLKTTPDKLTRRLSIARINQTDLIKITATAANAKEASDIANAHVGSFLQTWERMEGEGARMTLEFARDQMGKAAERLRTSEARLKEFRSAAMPESRAATSQRAADLASQEAQIERQLLAARAGLKAAQTEIAHRSREGGGGGPAIGLMGSELAAAGDRLRRLETNLQDAKDRNDPAAAALETRVRAARAALARAGAQMGAEPALADATARRVALLVEIAQQEAQLGSLRRERVAALTAAQKAEAEAVTYAELQREVALREADYRALAERAGQARLMADGASRSPIRIVDPAAPPEKPASRRLPLKIALASLVAAIGTLGILHVKDLSAGRFLAGR